MVAAYVYTLPGCGACERAKGLAADKGYEVREVPIDNPVLELGVKMLFRDGALRAPVVVLPEKGIYTLSDSEPVQLLRLVSLEPDKVAV